MAKKLTELLSPRYKQAKLNALQDLQIISSNHPYLRNLQASPDFLMNPKCTWQVYRQISNLLTQHNLVIRLNVNLMFRS